MNHEKILVVAGLLSVHQIESGFLSIVDISNHFFSGSIGRLPWTVKVSVYIKRILLIYSGVWVSFLILLKIVTNLVKHLAIFALMKRELRKDDRVPMSTSVFLVPLLIRGHLPHLVLQRDVYHVLEVIVADLRILRHVSLQTVPLLPKYLTFVNLSTGPSTQELF